MKRYHNFILLLLNLLCYFSFKVPEWSFAWSKNVLLPLNNYSRFFTKGFGFSVGDILYAALFLNLLFLCIQTIRNIKKTKLLRLWSFRLVKGILLIVLSFQLLWTAQIHNDFVAHYFKVNKNENVSTREVQHLYVICIDTLNKLCFKRSEKISKPYYQEQCINSFSTLTQQIKTASYHNSSFKKSLYSAWLNYMGVSGYYNPLSGEAHINKFVPDVTYCFTACHEIAHQLGFASEDDANFVSYYCCMQQNDQNMQYAAWLQLYRYARSRIKHIDSNFLIQAEHQLNSISKSDIQKTDAFWKQYEGRVGEANDWFYNAFMKFFGQKKGLQTYSKMLNQVIILRRNEQLKINAPQAAATQ